MSFCRRNARAHTHTHAHTARHIPVHFRARTNEYFDDCGSYGPGGKVQWSEAAATGGVDKLLCAETIRLCCLSKQALHSFQMTQTGSLDGIRV